MGTKSGSPSAVLIGTGWILCQAAVPTSADAADLVADLRIDQAKVYPTGAVVTRKGTVDIPAGEHHLIVKGLPSSLDENAFHVIVGSKSVRLGEVELKKISQTDYVGQSEQQLQKKLQTLNDSHLAIEDEIATAQTQLKILDSLANTPSGPSAHPTVDVTNLSALIGAVGTSAGNARARIRDALSRQRALDSQIAAVKADLGRIATDRKDSYELHAILEASTAVTSPVEVGYRIEAASWHFIYEAHLDTAARHVVLTREASVEQGSGEDWSDIGLVLTSAQPEEKVSVPKLSPLFLSLAQPLVVARATNSAISPAPMAAPDAAPFLGNLVAQEVVVTGAKRQVSVSSTDYAAEYTIPGRVSLLADREDHSYSIGGDEFVVDLVARAVPNVSKAAFIEAAFKFDRDVPWGAGDMQLYRDGAFVGSVSASDLLPGADVRLPFGVDDRIRVELHRERAESGVRGILGGQMVDEHRFSFVATSFHSVPVVLELIDRLPVSQNAAINVEPMRDATPPTTRDLDGKSGVLLWRLTLPPRQSATVKQHYSVGYPRSQRLEQFESEPGN